MGKVKISLLVFIAILGWYGQVRAQTSSSPSPIINPVLPGFNPDPCIVRTGNDYYLVTSTFEWFPGIPVYHSTDLSEWKQIGYALDRKSQLDMTGIADADGVYAPSITYHNGTYYVMYTTVQDGLDWSIKGYPNYVVTASDPAGPWSEPVYINSLGFDPSLFIDDNGKGYVLVRIFDHRKGKTSSPGIGMHEIDLETLKPLGTPQFIYSGWAEKSAEGPKMLKKGDYYYLFTAEGGTGYGHYQAVARSRNIWGPYERAPQIFYTARHDSTAAVQKAGHGTLFTSPGGEWYTTHLGSRPLEPYGYSPLGRETFIQPVTWNEQGWPEIPGGALLTEIPVGTPPVAAEKSVVRDEFDGDKPSLEYLFLREPYESDWLRMDIRKGYLALRGRNPLGSRYRQSMLARRVTSYEQEFETCLLFDPRDFRHSAGMTCYYNTRHFYSLGLTFDEELGTVLELIEADERYTELHQEKVRLNSSGEIFLKVKISGYDLQFYYSPDGENWMPVGPRLDFGKISDEYANGYTGAMVGLFAQDMLYGDRWAYFDYLVVRTE